MESLDQSPLKPMNPTPSPMSLTPRRSTQFNPRCLSSEWNQEVMEVCENFRYVKDGLLRANQMLQNYNSQIIGKYNTAGEKSDFLKQFLQRLIHVNEALGSLNLLLGESVNTTYRPCDNLDLAVIKIKEEIEKIRLTLSLQQLIQKFEVFSVNN